MRFARRAGVTDDRPGALAILYREPRGAKAAVVDYQQQKGVKLRVIEYPYQSLFEKLVIALSSDSSSYDLVMIDDPWFPRCAQMEGLQALAPLFLTKGRAGPDDDFVEASLALGRYPYGTGELYGLPYVGNTQLFFYRKDLYEKLGISAPRTWDEVYETGKLIGAPAGSSAIEWLSLLAVAVLTNPARSNAK